MIMACGYNGDALQRNCSCAILITVSMNAVTKTTDLMSDSLFIKFVCMIPKCNSS